MAPDDEGDEVVSTGVRIQCVNTVKGKRTVVLSTKGEDDVRGSYEKGDLLLPYVKRLFETFYDLFFNEKTARAQEQALHPVTSLLNAITHEEILIDIIKPERTFQ